jgi:hypothetical protein
LKLPTKSTPSGFPAAAILDYWIAFPIGHHNSVFAIPGLDPRIDRAIQHPREAIFY